jgi:hypothetical protein
MATETMSPPSQSTSTTAPPHLTIINRVASIPLISDSLAVLHATLTNNAYTNRPYSFAHTYAVALASYSEPIQTRLAPVISRADGLANAAVDVIEKRYPYPFSTPTDEIYGDLRMHGEHAYGVANKTIDEKVKSPAFGFAQGIDQVRDETIRVLLSHQVHYS